MTVAELLSRISSRELSEWSVFYGLEPFGFDADYLGHAQTSATLVNINRKKGSKAVSAKEFFPKFDETADDAVGFAKTMNAMHGGETTYGGHR